MFRIIQELNIDEIEDEYLDCTDLTIGYVTDEFFAQEFCNQYSCCKYEEVIPIKYPIYLKANMCHNADDLMLLKIPVKKIE